MVLRRMVSSRCMLAASGSPSRQEREECRSTASSRDRALSEYTGVTGSSPPHSAVPEGGGQKLNLVAARRRGGQTGHGGETQKCDT